MPILFEFVMKGSAAGTVMEIIGEEVSSTTLTASEFLFPALSIMPAIIGLFPSTRLRLALKELSPDRAAISLSPFIAFLTSTAFGCNSLLSLNVPMTS